MSKLSLSELLTDFIALFYPRYCDACLGDLVKGEEILCSRCLLELPRTDYHLSIYNPLFLRMHSRVRIHHALAFLRFVKKGSVQQLIHNLKYKNRPEIGTMLGLVYGFELAKYGYRDHFDYIVPVPLHPTRQRQRGYNQSEEFAKGLSQSLQIPIKSDVIRKDTETKTQTRRTKIGRWDNVKMGFSVCSIDEVLGKRILLVDDVITTGATLEACGKQLCEVTQLSIACIAATQ